MNGEEIVLAVVGDVVTCECGEEICTVVKDVTPENFPSLACFDAWRQGPAPEVGAELGPCAVCGSMSPWRIPGGGMQPRTRDGRHLTGGSWYYVYLVPKKDGEEQSDDDAGH